MSKRINSSAHAKQIRQVANLIKASITPAPLLSRQQKEQSSNLAEDSSISPAYTPPLTILRRKQVEERTGLRRSTIYKHINAGTFPSPIALSGRAVGWLEEEIVEWLHDRIRATRSGTHGSNRHD